MKRLDLSRRKWLSLRAENEARRHGKKGGGRRWAAKFDTPGMRSVSRVQIWEGGDPEWAICLSKPIIPPSLLCFDRNRAASFAWFERLRRSSQNAIDKGVPFVERSSRPGALPQISGYFDFSKLKEISTAAAVVLAAEYERIGKLLHIVPPTVELDKWHDAVFAKLYQIGFFEIVGLTPPLKNLVLEEEKKQTMRIVSSKNSDDLETIDKSLQQLGKFLSPDQALPEKIIIEFLTGLSEAISNVTNHAYGNGIPLPYDHIESLWVAATADRDANSLTVVVYDQGATIPATYPRLDRLKKVVRFLALALKPDKKFEYEDDGTYIRAAMRYGGSRTDEKHRGKGLPQMFETLQKIGPGILTIYSRGGWCRQTTHGKRLSSGSLSHSIGGTLVEWSVQLSDIRS
ncbi:hypothetical protein [Mesorhizobium sp.]|uniref:hypothetical protein n=1 Tax=Mesorhizobium sp. TaxID=1871066 RepID=UPI003BAB43A6